MSLNITIPEVTVIKPKISVFGVGGAGGNALNNMINSNLEGVEFIAANTDAQSLQNSLASNRIQLGLNVTKGLGAGSVPDCGKSAAEENIDEINHYLEGNNMVFITAGMGGGTGTGAAPVIARAAKEKDILTVGVITKPFDFEGKYRMESALKGIEELKKYVDTLIVIPNQNLFRIATENTTFESAFKMADNVLHAGVRGITDLITMPGLVNLDFADIKTIMTKMGKAMMGTGEAEGENRAIVACQEAISNPLLDDVSIKGARGVLVNMTGGTDMTLFEADQAVNEIRKQVDENANIIFGSAFNENMNGKIRVSVVATGIDVMEYDNLTSSMTEGTTQEDDIPAFFDPSDIKHDNLSIGEINPENFQPEKDLTDYGAEDQGAIEQNLESNKKVIDLEVSNTPIDSNIAADNDNNEITTQIEEGSDEGNANATEDDKSENNNGFSLFRFITGKKQDKPESKKIEKKEKVEEDQKMLDFTFHDNTMDELPKEEDLISSKDDNSPQDNNSSEDDVLNIPTFFRKKNNM